MFFFFNVWIIIFLNISVVSLFKVKYLLINFLKRGVLYVFVGVLNFLIGVISVLFMIIVIIVNNIGVSILLIWFINFEGFKVK